MGNRCPHSLNTSCNPMRTFAQRHSSQVTARWPGSGVPLGPGSLGPPGSCSLGRAGLLRTHTPDLSLTSSTASVNSDFLHSPCSSAAATFLIFKWSIKSDHSDYENFPGGSDGKESACNARKPRFDPWVGKIPWRRKSPLPLFLPGGSHGQRSLVGYSPWGLKESDTTEQLTRVVIVIMKNND